MTDSNKKLARKILGAENAASPAIDPRSPSALARRELEKRERAKGPEHWQRQRKAAGLATPGREWYLHEGRAALADKHWLDDRISAFDLVALLDVRLDRMIALFEDGRLPRPERYPKLIWSWDEVSKLVNLIVTRRPMYGVGEEKAWVRTAKEFEAYLTEHIEAKTTNKTGTAAPQRSKPKELPEEPPKLWTGGAPGRPRAGIENALVAFIREVYGPYMKEHRAALREYIHQHDKKLYQAIANYERKHTLPEDLRMPSQRARVRERFDRAVNEGGLDALGAKERRSVVATLRHRSKSP